MRSLDSALSGIVNPATTPFVDQLEALLVLQQALATLLPRPRRRPVLVARRSGRSTAHGGSGTIICGSSAHAWAWPSAFFHHLSSVGGSLSDLSALSALSSLRLGGSTELSVGAMVVLAVLAWAAQAATSSLPSVDYKRAQRHVTP